MAITFPASPADGAQFTVGARKWIYSTAKGAWLGGTSSLEVGNITGIGTGVAAALANTANTSGGIVLANGTSSLNINGTVGATTPAAGTFTTINGSSLVRVGTATTADALSDVLIAASATTQSGLTVQGKPSQSASIFRVVESSNNTANNGWSFAANSATVAQSGAFRYISPTNEIFPPAFFAKWSTVATTPFGAATFSLGPTVAGSKILAVGNGTQFDTSGGIKCATVDATTYTNIPSLTTVASISAAGNTALAVSATDTMETFIVPVTAGAGAYTATVSLNVSAAVPQNGTIAIVKIDLPASNNPRIQLRSNTTVIGEAIGNGIARTVTFRCNFDGSAWFVASRLPSTEIFDFTRSIAPGGATWDGSKWAWVVPQGMQRAEALLLSGGGGGGSGRRGAASTARGGGGGGSGGAYGIIRFLTVELPTTNISITPGAAGVGGAAITTDDTNGNNGTDGGGSSIHHTNSPLMIFGNFAGGKGGAAGTTSGGAGGATTNPSVTGIGDGGGEVGASGSATGNGNSGSGGRSRQIGGGGGGGAASSANVAYNGGNGGLAIAYPFAESYFSYVAIGGVAPGGAGAAGTPPAGELYLFGRAGAGGAASITGAAGSGGLGYRGGPGGGGGASLNGFASGAGGNGSDGFVRITAFY